MQNLGRGWQTLVGSCAILLVAAATAANARAQNLGPEVPPGEIDHPERVVDGHIFPIPAFTPTAFLSTRFSFRQGLTQVSVADFPIAQNLVLDVDLLGINERIEAGVRFADRFEVYGFGTGEVLSGVSASSVVVGGAHFAYSGGLGGRIRLFRSSRSGTELTARVEGSAGRGGLLDLLRLADALIDDPNPAITTIVNESLGRLILGKTTRSEIGGQVLVAQSLGPNFDLQGALGASYNRLSFELYNAQTDLEFEQDFNSVDPVLSAAFGANIAQLVPIGFLLEYSVRSHRRALTSSIEDDWTNPSHLIGLGIHTLHPNFQVGLTFARLMNLERISRIDPTTGQSLTSERPVVHYVQLGMDVVW